MCESEPIDEKLFRALCSAGVRGTDSETMDEINAAIDSLEACIQHVDNVISNQDTPERTSHILCHARSYLTRRETPWAKAFREQREAEKRKEE